MKTSYTLTLLLLLLLMLVPLSYATAPGAVILSGFADSTPINHLTWTTPNASTDADLITSGGRLWSGQSSVTSNDMYSTVAGSNLTVIMGFGTAGIAPCNGLDVEVINPNDGKFIVVALKNGSLNKPTGGIVPSSFTTGANAIYIRHVNVSANIFYVEISFIVPSGVTSIRTHWSSDGTCDFTGNTQLGPVNNWTLPRNLTDASLMTGWKANLTCAVCTTGNGKQFGYLFNTIASPGLPLGYNLSRWDDASNSLTIFHLGPVNSYNDSGSLTNRSYQVRAFTGGGDGPLSNNVTLKSPVLPLVGDCSVLWVCTINSNGNVTHNRAQAAAEGGFTYAGLGAFYALLAVAGFATMGYTFTSSSGRGVIGAIAGAVFGLVFATILDLIPYWITFFIGLLILVGAIYRMRNKETNE